MSVQIPSQEDEPRIEAAAEAPATRRWRPRGIGPAFWTLASIFSLIVNVILIVVVLVLACGYGCAVQKLVYSARGTLIFLPSSLP